MPGIEWLEVVSGEMRRPELRGRLLLPERGVTEPGAATE